MNVSSNPSVASGSTSVAGGLESSDAAEGAAELGLVSQTTQADAKNADKADKAGPAKINSEEKVAEKPLGKSALAATKDLLAQAGETPQLLTEFVMGLSKHAIELALRDPAEREGQAKHFEGALAKLVPPTGAPGAAFKADVSGLKEKVIALPKLLVLSTATPATKGAQTPAKPMPNEVRAAQTLATKTLNQTAWKAAMESQVGQFSPRSQLLAAKAAEHVAHAIKLTSEKSPLLRLEGKGKTASELHKKLEAMLEAASDGAGVKDTEVELPSPALVELEKAQKTFVQAIETEREDRSAAGLGMSAGKATRGDAGAALGNAASRATQTDAGDGAAPDQAPASGAVGQGSVMHISEQLLEHGDVMALASMIMMQGAQIADDSLRELFKEMQKNNDKKQSLRSMASQAKQYEADTTSQLQQEFNGLQGSGAIAPGVKFDDYKGWRQIHYAPLQENFSASGDTTYSLAQPALGPAPKPEDLPMFLAKGPNYVAPANGAAKADLASKYAVAPEIMDTLLKIYNDAGIKSPDFETWLQNKVKILPAHSLQAAQDNFAAITKFAGTADASGLLPKAKTDSVADLTKSTDPKLQAVALAATALLHANMLRQKFPNAHPQPDVNQLSSDLDDAKKSLSSDEMQTFKAWGFSNSKGGLLAERRRFSTTLRTAAEGVDPRSYEIDVKESKAYRNGDDGNHKDYVGGMKDGLHLFLKEGATDDRDVSLKISPEEQAHPPSVVLDVDNGALSPTEREGAVQDDGGNGTDDHWRAEVKYKPKVGVNGKTDNSLSTAYKECGVTGAITFSGPPSTDDPSIDITTILGDTSAVSHAEPDPDSPTGLINSDLEQLKGQASQSAYNPVGADGKAAQFLQDSVSWAKPKPPPAPASAAAPPPPPSFVDSATGIPLNNMGTVDQLTASLAGIQDKLDALKDMDELQQMRLQKAMESRSKVLETLSNMMKSDDSLSKTIRDNTK